MWPMGHGLDHFGLNAPLTTNTIESQLYHNSLLNKMFNKKLKIIFCRDEM